jgi:inhibitor of growth protein 4
MSKGTHLEDYLEGVSGLPSEVTRNLVLMRELDAQVQNTLAHVAVLSASDGDAVSATATAADTTQAMRAELRDAQALSEEKVALARQTYDLVDRSIRRLDATLRRFEAELDGPAGSAATPDDGTTYGGADPSDELYMPEQAAAAAAACISHRKGARKGEQAAGTRGVRTFEVEMPIDPNEPTYCICKSVSFGQMVGCDNPTCKIEWFHFQCVGLTANPKGKWYCPSCRAALKRQIV